MYYMLQASAGGGYWFPYILLFFIVSMMLTLLYNLDKRRQKKREESYRKMSKFQLQNEVLKKHVVIICWAFGVHHFMVGKWYIGIPYLFTIFWGWVFMWTPLLPIGVVILLFAGCWAITDLFLINRLVNNRNNLIYKVLEEKDFTGINTSQK